jgi:hypothetical protein
MKTSWDIVYLMAWRDDDIGLEAVLTRKGSLPFFPQIGMHLDTGEGNTRKITDIYYTATDGKVEVWFENEEAYGLDKLKKWGWGPDQ